MSSCGLSVSIWSLLLASALCSCRPVAGAYLLDWFGFGDSSSEDNRNLAIKDGVPLLKVPFEEVSPEDKFLREAEKYVGLKQSELDNCQHKVVMKIRSSCASITEEDLAKLSVNLLNCQSAVEGRQQFPCTDKMSLRDCTSKMDSDMWNTYHLMNNRARAVCYAARHQQFRALSEMTVNKLMTTAHEQLKAMDTLKDGQSKLEILTSGTLESVSKGHQTLMAEQEKLRTTQQSVHDFVALNLRELTREKALIAAGQRELALMTKEVKTRLDEASQQLSNQALEREENHVQVLADLDNLQKKAYEIWDRVDSSTAQILAQHAVAAEDLEHMLKNLARINATIDFLLKTVEKTRSEIDERLGWIIKFIGDSGEQVEWMQQCLGHAMFLVLGMVAASFVHAPLAVRCALVLIVPLNLVLTAHEGSEAALDFPGITVVIFAFTAVHWLLSSLNEWLYPKQHVPMYYLRGDPSWHAQNVMSPMQNGSTTSNVPVTLLENSAPITDTSASWLSRCFQQLRQQCSQWLYTLQVKSNFNILGWWSSKVPIPQSTSQAVSSNVHEANDDESDNEGSVEQEIRLSRSFTGTPLRTNVTMLRSDSPASSRSSRSFTPVRSGTPKVQCQGRTKTGQLCRNSALPGSETCRTHSSFSGPRG